MEEKVLAVEKVFEELDEEIRQFQHWSGLHCLHGCGKCCFKPDITATILEFLPFAHHLYKNGIAQEWYDKLKVSKDGICLILNPTQDGAGLCSEYRHRGLICRLFGFTARTNKYGIQELVTCQVIKSEQSQNYAEAAKSVSDKTKPIALMQNYYMQLMAIDDNLSRDHYPINESIQKAIEVVLAYYAYR